MPTSISRTMKTISSSWMKCIACRSSSKRCVVSSIAAAGLARRQGDALLGLKTKDDVLGHPVAGQTWETVVIETLIAVAPEGTVANFYRTAAGAEIDLVLTLPDRQRWAIEIKRSSAPKVEQGFHSAVDDLKPKRQFVVYPGSEEFSLGNDIQAIGLTALGRQLQTVKKVMIDRIESKASEVLLTGKRFAYAHEAGSCERASSRMISICLCSDGFELTLSCAAWSAAARIFSRCLRRPWPCCRGNHCTGHRIAACAATERPLWHFGGHRAPRGLFPADRAILGCHRAVSCPSQAGPAPHAPICGWRRLPPQLASAR